MRIVRWPVLWSVPFLILAFQNCGSDVDFSMGTAVAGPGAVGVPGQPPSPEVNDSAPEPSPALDCGNRFLVNGKCEDFSCQSVVVLGRDQLMSIPARTAEGICYAYRLSDPIANGPSGLTMTTDSEVVSRNHDVVSDDPTRQHHPYLMLRFQGELRLNGPRVVKLAGGDRADAPIKVDNFVLAGVFPKSLSLLPASSLSQYYFAQGTSDSSIADESGDDTRAISFNGQLIPVAQFATGGTASLRPIDISANAPSGVDLLIDVRAEDCGGRRELSEIWLLFQ